VATEPLIITANPPATQPAAFRQWSPAALEAAEVTADAGSLQLAADLCEYLMGDDRIGAVVDTRTGALLGLPLKFEASGDGRRSKRIVRALEAEDDWFEAFSEAELKAVHADAIMLGVGLGQLVWTERRGRLLPVLRRWHPRWLSYDYGTREWRLTVAGEGRTTKQITIKPGDGKWVMLTPGGSDRPWVRGAYRALSRWVLLKQYAIRDWASVSERHGHGTRVVKCKGQPKDEMRKQIVTDIRALARNAVIALPEGFDFSMVESTAKTHESFKQQIDACDNGAAIAILGQNLTTQAVSGASGTASVHRDVAFARTREDAESQATTYREQALTWWADFNFGNRELAPWPLRDTQPTEDLKERAATMQMLGQAIATLMTSGAPVDIAALCEQFRVPTTEVQPAPAAQPAQPAPAPESAPAEGQ
jgi:phage gp29-like protein